MVNVQRFNDTSFSEKKLFFSNMTILNITDTDYKHSKRVWRDFKIPNLGNYHDDIYVQGDTLLLSDVYKNLHNKFVIGL